MLKNSCSHPKSCRVRASKDFKFILQKGIKFSQRNLLFFVVENSSCQKLGVVVSKKCYKSAVKRNRLRRINKEHFRHLQNKVLGFSIVVVVRPNISKLTDQDIFSETQRQWGNFLKCLLKQ